ncbi:TIR domain-containing protein [Paraburkholderia aromaticivorans]|uniref:TIR domain-containing protein n=1 Tax=Paraburkholderia aromaticivorans TaxID=2026199 RepID=UPI001455DE27|nr:TIR domain-containing protein [Paraburkholderia aromaticivorans]
MAEPLKPRIFIGSSSEGSDVAHAIQTGLGSGVECTVWDQGTFELGKSTLNNLYEFIEKFDFAIFVAAPDDEVEVRGKHYSSTRDNVIFELGLFMGGLGTDRVIFITAGNIREFKLPSDLQGITHATYESERVDGNIVAAVGPACLAIQRHIAKKSKLPGRTKDYGLSYVGAICFRSKAKRIQYLLVSSDRNRIIFPKGDMKSIDSDAAGAAGRIAKKEAGVRGRIVDGKSRFIQYFNDEYNAVHRIEVFLLDISSILEVGHGWRNPQWFDLTESITALTSDRDYNTSIQLSQAMEWAEQQIRKYVNNFCGDSGEQKRKKKQSR